MRKMSSSRYKRPPNCSLFVKGLNLSSNSDDLRDLFTQYGPVRDVYLPLDYHTREPRGFAYVEFEDLRDAEDALHNLDGTCLHGRELVVQYAEGDRKTPFQMKNKERTGSYNRRRYSRSPSPYYSRRSHSPYNRRRRRGSPRSRRRRSRSRSYSRSGSRSRSPPPRRRRSQSRSRSPYSRSPVRSRSRSYSRSPGGRGRSYSRSPSRSPRSKSPKQ